MNMHLNLKHLFLVLVAISGLTSCTSDDNNAPVADGTIAQLIANSPDLSVLQAAIVRAGLETEFESSGNLTLFAPTDTAFNLFLATANFPSIDDVPVPVLQRLLLNHVLGARVDENLLRAIGKNYTETRADGPVSNTKLALFIDATSATIVLNGASDITDSDNAATNGILHVVDKVLDFPTLATFIQSNDAFSQLNLALTTATPATDFTATLSGSTNYTIFAPADVAFDELLDTDPTWNTVNDIEETLLTAVLQHHVISGNVRSTDISNNETAVTLEGDLIEFSTANGVVDITDGAGNAGITVIVANIQAVNGVLHAVDQVLLPDTSN